jgi:phage shock protein E
MNWMSDVAILAVVAFAYTFLKRATQISRKDALAHLEAGAPVIDVRSPGEFNSGHLPTAINIPVDEIETALPHRFKDKNQVLLLHCQSGMRSGAAKRKLAGLGYAHAFNLGSYARAAAILNTR